MVKGTHKRMVVVRTNKSRYYEQAYFVLRDGQLIPEEAESTMVAEANRILDESQLMPQPRGRRRISCVVAFWMGALAGAGVCALILLAVLL